MNWTIYVYGDLSVFQSVLNAVAMIFSPAAGILSSDSGLGLGVGILVSLLISLVVILASTMVAQATGGGSRNNLATLLMTVIILIETSAGYSVMPLDEFDGDPETIVSEYDPFNR